MRPEDLCENSAGTLQDRDQLPWLLRWPSTVQVSWPSQRLRPEHPELLVLVSQFTRPPLHWPRLRRRRPHLGPGKPLFFQCGRILHQDGFAQRGLRSALDSVLRKDSSNDANLGQTMPIRQAHRPANRQERVPRVRCLPAQVCVLRVDLPDNFGRQWRHLACEQCVPACNAAHVGVLDGARARPEVLVRLCAPHMHLECTRGPNKIPHSGQGTGCGSSNSAAHGSALAAVAVSVLQTTGNFCQTVRHARRPSSGSGGCLSLGPPVLSHRLCPSERIGVSCL